MKDYSNYYPSYEEVMLDNGRFMFEQQLQDFEGKDVLVDGVPTRALIQYHTNPLNEEKEDRKITCWNDIDIEVGSFVKIIEEDNDYIVITKVKHNDLIKYTKILQCNNTLTFQTPDTTIHTIPCILTDRASVYSDGVDDTKYLSLPDGLIKIVIPNNELTNTFDLLNKRLIFDHSKHSIFEVTKAEKLLKKGLIEIISKVEGYDENKDNLELNLSSYIEPVEVPTDPITLTITGVDRISVYDNPQTYTINSDLDVVWSINGTTAKIQSVNENSCVVTYVNSMQFGSNLLRCELVSDNSVFVEKTIEIVFM